MPIPLELVTLLGSSLVGGFMQITSRIIEARRQERTYVLQALSAESGIIDEARRYENRGFQWTRRVIALIAVFFVIAFPKIVAVLMPEVAVHIGYVEMSKGFWFLSGDTKEIVWQSMQGLVITPLDTHLLSAIIGLYFGGSLTH